MSDGSVGKGPGAAQTMPGWANGMPGSENTENRAIVSRSLDKVKVRSIKWLWQGWIPKGYVTLVAGETGASKSTILADIAARVSTGRPWPDDNDWRTPNAVMWLGSEDGTEDVLVPRLMACSADLRNVIELTGVIQQGARTTFSLQDDIVAVRLWLELAIEKHAPFSMIVIDPITSYLPGKRLRKVDMNDAGQLRSILEPWLKVAQDYNLAIVAVTHFSKDTTRSMLHRVLGSAAFAQTCRSLLAVVHRPDDGMYARSLIQVKTNLPDHPGGAWLFETDVAEVDIDDEGDPVNATYPVWQRIDHSVTPESVIGRSERGPVGKKTHEYAAAFPVWLKAFFMTTPSEDGQPVTLPVMEVKKAALAAKIVSEKWWDENSSAWLDKRNINGTWMCRLYV